MPLYRPSELLAFLKAHGAVPQRSLSQNFLIDANIVHKMVQLASIQRDDCILEIGPGPGAISEAILETGAFLIAVEKDPLFARELSRLIGRLEVHEADILKFPIESLPGPLKCISNLPYQLTTPILTRLLPLYPHVSLLVLMVQEEYARRIVAKPKNKDYSSLSIFTHFFSHPKYICKVSRNSSYPPPSVDSAIVTLELKKAPEIDCQAFFALVHAAFTQRRKMLRTSLMTIYPKNCIVEALEKMYLKEETRPEELSLEQFIQLFTLLRERIHQKAPNATQARPATKEPPVT